MWRPLSDWVLLKFFSLRVFHTECAEVLQFTVQVVLSWHWSPRRFLLIFAAVRSRESLYLPVSLSMPAGSSSSLHPILTSRMDSGTVVDFSVWSALHLFAQNSNSQASHMRGGNWKSLDMLHCLLEPIWIM